MREYSHLSKIWDAPHCTALVVFWNRADLLIISILPHSLSGNSNENSSSLMDKAKSVLGMDTDKK